MDLNGNTATVHEFDGSDGSEPASAAVETPAGSLLGTTDEGGPSSAGTIFSLTPGAAVATVNSFNPLEGSRPTGDLVLATDGNYYGTAYEGGASGGGAIYKITPAGEFTTLYTLAPGSKPYAGLQQGTDGNFYGTTQQGGTGGFGPVYRLKTGLAPFVKTVPRAAFTGAAVKILGTNLNGATRVTFNGHRGRI